MLTRLALLIIDADPARARCHAERARGLGLQVTLAASGNSARARMAETGFDLVLADRSSLERAPSDRAAPPGAEPHWLQHLAHTTGCRLFWSMPADSVEVESVVAEDTPTGPHAGAPMESALRGAVADLQRAAQAARAASPVLIGESPAAQELRRRVARLRTASAPVLLQAEPGSCKSSVARALHPAGSGQFFAPQGLLSGSAAVERRLRGFIDSVTAPVGDAATWRRHTLFLRALLELAPEQQTQLARALETAAQRGPAPSPGHRLIAAVDRDVEQSLRAGALCSQLVAQVQHCRILLPPLRERGEDVPALAEHFLERINRRHGTGKRFDARAHARLQAWSWPGNLRELRQTVESAYHAARRDCVRPQAGVPWAKDTAESLVFRVGTSLQEMQRQLLLKTLAYYGNNRTQAARALGVSARTIYNRLESLRAHGSELPGGGESPTGE